MRREFPVRSSHRVSTCQPCKQPDSARMCAKKSLPKVATFFSQKWPKKVGGGKLGWKDGEKSLGERKMRGRGGAKDFIGCRALTTRTFLKPHHHARF